MRIRLFLVGISYFLCLVVGAQPLQILTENDPPAQFVDAKGELTGYTIELVRDIQRRLGNQDPIEMVPWARGYQKIEREPNVVLFLMARTAERNPKFQWVGPVLEVEFGLFAKANSSLKVASLDDARKVGSIGVYRDDARDQMLTAAGFTNLERVNNNILNVKKLMAGRIDLYAGSTTSFGVDAVEAGFQPSDLKMVVSMDIVQIYIAMSKDMPTSVVDHWNAAVKAQRQDGTMARLLAKYYPHTKVPGPARTKF